MPQSQSHPAVPTQVPMSPASLDAAARAFTDESEMLLGFECADPTLQIERWRQEAAGPGEPS
jgi:hypothetical protein